MAVAVLLEGAAEDEMILACGGLVQVLADLEMVHQVAATTEEASAAEEASQVEALAEVFKNFQLREFARMRTLFLGVKLQI